MTAFSGRETRSRDFPVVPVVNRRISMLRERALSVLDDRDLDEDCRGLLKAMLLAERSQLDRSVRDDWRDAGAAHFLALSGLHLGLVAAPLMGILTIAGARGFLRDSIALLVLSLYSSIAGSPGSLIRAMALLATVRAHRLAGMRTDLAGSVFCGAFAACLIRPSLLGDTGFILSFCAVSGIALLGAPLYGRLQKASVGARSSTFLLPGAGALLISLSVQAFMLPLIVHMFGVAPAAGPLMSVILILPVTALLYGGFLYFALRLVPGGLAAVPLNMISLMANKAVSMGAGCVKLGIVASDFRNALYIPGLGLTVMALRFCRAKRVLFAAGMTIIAASFYPAFVNDGSGHRTDVIIAADRCAVYGGDGGILVLEKMPSPSFARYLVREMRRAGIRGIKDLVICEARNPVHGGIAILVDRFRPARVIASPWIDALFPSIEECRGRNPKWVGLREDLRLKTGGITIVLHPPQDAPSRGTAASVEAASLRISLLDCRMDDG